MNYKKQGELSFFRIAILILAGEAIFILPFVLARIFRPTFLDVFQLTNVALGTCFSIYGIVALGSYFFGGPLADRFPPRILMSVALILTAFGGLVMASYPSYFVMQCLFGYWGFTTIFLFWAAMVKATRIWGGSDHQGKAFGFLDGGRGLVAAGFGSIGVFIFSNLIAANPDIATFEERRLAFRYVILFSSLLVGLIGVLVFLFMNSRDTDTSVDNSKTIITLSKFSATARYPTVWLLMIIVLCAYVGYKITDVFPLYANEVMGYNEIASAQVGTFLLYIRPVVGVAIGLLADRTRASLWIIIGFLTMLFGAFLFSSGIIAPQLHWMFFFGLLVTAFGTYTVRTLYFAVLQEGKIPLEMTGAAVGLISFVGYTPDIFVGPVMGYLLDNNPDESGHQQVFLLLATFATIGLIASVFFFRMTIKRVKETIIMNSN